MDKSQNSYHEEIMRDLIEGFKTKIDNSVPDNESYTELEYTNLGISRLHNRFFEIYARESGTDKTNLLRKFLNALMVRNPDIVEKAKSSINQEYGDSNG